jgi:hypothetical protein
MQRLGCGLHLPIKTALDLKELINRCVRGDREGQKLLFERFATPMARLCMRYIKDHDDAQDMHWSIISNARFTCCIPTLPWTLVFN